MKNISEKMKYIIDESVCAEHNLTLPETLCLLACKSCDNIYELIEEMQRKELLTKHGNPYPTPTWEDELSAVLLEADKTIPLKDRCMKLAEQMRLLFPKGIKTGNAAWRGNVREVTLRLQKFFKLYGSAWTDEEILDATRRYIAHFNGDYTFMRILKYFIMKSDKKTDEEGNTHIEDISELATWLENETEEKDLDWLQDVR